MRVKHSTKYVSDELEDNKTKKKKITFFTEVFQVRYHNIVNLIYTG